MRAETLQTQLLAANAEVSALEIALDKLERDCIFVAEGRRNLRPQFKRSTVEAEWHSLQGMLREARVKKAEIAAEIEREVAKEPAYEWS